MKTKNCCLCCKTIRGDHLKRHMKRQEKKTNVIYEFETPRSDAFGEMKHFDKDESSMSVELGVMKHIDEAGTNRRVTSSEKCMNLEMLEKKIVTDMKEFDRKLILGEM